MTPALKAAELVQVGPIRGLAQYVAIAHPGVGWMLRLEVDDDHVIEGWGVTQEEARFMFLETCKQWLKNTNVDVAIR